MDSNKVDLANITPGLAVDIDETLSWTIGYWVQEMQKKFGNPENLTIHELIKKYRYTQNVPYWQSKEARDWMEHHRNSDEVQEVLPLIEGSPTFLNKINEIIPISAYLTIRPQIVVNGTQKWLKKHNFPNAPVISRPKEVLMADGNKWKAKVLQENFPKIKGIIDDNPNLVNLISSDYKGLIFLYDHEPVESKLNVIACKDWKEVYAQVKEYYSKKM
ncbi:MAG: hypothetical protein AABW59_02120 [archaeon]